MNTGEALLQAHISAIVNMLSKNDQILSRTSTSGTIDAGVSVEKKSIANEKSIIQAQVAANRIAAAEYIAWRSGTPHSTPQELVLWLIALSETVNKGLSNSGTLRSWHIKDRVYGGEADIEPGQIFDKLLALEIDIGQCQSDVDAALKHIAVIEWQIGIGPLHPFADACGRVSRYFSLLLSLRYGCPAVLHRNRDDYFAHGCAGRNQFAEYYLGLERIKL